LKECWAHQLPNAGSVHRYSERWPPPNAPVLILGESGTGKEMAALAIHPPECQGKEGPFIRHQLRGDPGKTLLESELFGH